MAEQPRHRDPSHAEQAGRASSGNPPYETHNEPQTHGPSGGEQPGNAGRPGGPASPEQRYTEPADRGWRDIGRRISWGAIFAGVVVALAVQLLLSVLGIGIGAAVMDPAQGADGTAWTIGAGLWWVITGLIALFLGGWVAGHLATNPDRRDGALHGVVTWGLASLIGVWLLTTTIGTVTAGAWSVVATGMETGAELQSPAAAQDPQQQPIDPQTQQELEETLQEAQQQAPQVLEQADEALAHAGIWTFIAMLLGAAAAGIGGYLATPQNAPTAISRR